MDKSSTNLRNSIIWLYLISIIYACIQVFVRPFFQNYPYVNQFVSFAYIWSPGLVALVFARKEGMKLPIFSKPGKLFYLIPLITLAVCGFGFLLSLPFGAGQTINPAFVDQSWMQVIGLVILLFFTSYLLLAIVFSFLFLGGELFWRGYLWEKLKNRGALKAIWITALLWALWQIPVSVLSYSPGMPSFWLNMGFMAFLIFSLSPVLTYFRVKGQSIFTAAAFYSSLISAFAYFIVLFPMFEPRIIGFFGVFCAIGLVLLSLLFKLYSSSNWKKLL